MDFLKILRSLEELVYEILTWLLLYPRTLWRAVRDPLSMLERTTRELGKPPDSRFTDQVSPILFLLLSLLLSQAVGLALRVPPTVDERMRASPIFGSAQNLLLLRALLFASYPLTVAQGILRRQRVHVDRESLRAPFFAHCYVATPFVLAESIALSSARRPELAGTVVAVLLSCGALLWYVGSLTRVVERQLAVSRARASRTVLWLVGLATIVLGLGIIAAGLALYS